MTLAATHARVVVALLTMALTSGACAAKLYQPPPGPGQPFADAASVWQSVAASCRNANRFVAEIEIGGWVGEPRERVPTFTAHGAVTRDDDIYLEVKPLGKTVLEMAGRAGQAVLLLPPDNRVLRAASRDIIDRLVGLRWGPRDLLNVLTGCVTTPTGLFSGTSYGKEASIELGGDARAYVRQQGGRWRLVAATRDGLLIEYREYLGAFPSIVRVSSAAGSVTPLHLTFHVGQHQVNIPLEAGTFSVEVPPNFLPMTLDELRSAKPLKEGKDREPSASRKPQAVRKP